MKSQKPKPPLSIMIREGSIGDCPTCRSSQVRRYLTNTMFEFGPKIGCIQPKCKNYYLNKKA